MKNFLFIGLFRACLPFFNKFRMPVIFLALFFIFPACKDDDKELTPSDEITLSSETLGSQPYYSMGYSFEDQKFSQRLGSTSNIDIYLNELLNPKGELTGIQFSTNTISESSYGFYLNEVFPDPGSAEEFYNGYTQALFPEYTPLTDTIKLFQVYTFRTWKSNYVKFYVKDIRVIYENESAEYMEVTIKYFIQRDGSVNFAS